MKIYHPHGRRRLGQPEERTCGLSDADAQRPLPLSIIQILAVDLGTDMLPGPPARQAKYGKGWAIYAFPRGCRWPNVY